MIIPSVSAKKICHTLAGTKNGWFSAFGLQGRPIWAFAPPEDHPEGTPDTGDFWSKI